MIADGAMGTMLQRYDLSIEGDFQGLEGCNEILNVSRPDVVAAIHDAYLEVGVDAVETNTFGANWSNLGDYGIDDRIAELAAAGARIARERVEAAEAADGRVRWVLGSMGPGTKLPSLGHTTYDNLKQTFALQAEGLIDGGADAFLVETSQDLLQTKAAINGCRQAIVSRGIRLPIFVEVTVETTGTMLMGSEIGAALTAIEPLGVDAIGLNCATGPTEMSEHLRHLSKHATVPVACMPNAGLPVLGANGAHYPLSPAELATAHEQFVREFGLGLVGGCCGTTPEHLAAVVERLAPSAAGRRRRRDAVRSLSLSKGPEEDPGVASLYQHVSFQQDASYLAIGERTNANGSKAFREAMLEERWDDCVEIARDQIRVGAHLLDVCTDYVGRDGVADMREVVSRLASASTLPLVIDSTEPAVIAAGLELIGGRPVVNSVNYEDGDGPTSRFGRIMPLVKEHGTAVVALTIDEHGQARTTEGKVQIASRLIDELVGEWGLRVERHHRRLPDVPDRDRPGGDPPRRHRDDRGDPPDHREVPGHQHDPRRLERVVRPEPGRAQRAELGVPARGGRGRARPRASSTRRRSCRSPRSPTSSARSRSTSCGTAASTTPTATSRTTRWHGCSTSSPASTPRRCATSAPPSSPRCRSASGSSGASSTARARASRPTSTSRARAGWRRCRSSTTTCSRA